MLGAGHSISQVEAAGCTPPRLLGEHAPELLANFAAYGADPFTEQLDTVAELLPELTVIGGEAVNDPGGLLA